MVSTLAELARLVEGIPVGEPDLPIHGVAPIQSAAQGEITFLEKADKLQRLSKCRASAVVVPLGTVLPSHAVIQTRRVVEAFETITRFFTPNQPAPPRTISEQASISPTATIGDNVLIEPFVLVGDNVLIGDDCTLHSGVRVGAGSRIGRGTLVFSNAVLYENTEIGEDCIIHACSVIGAYGFGYASSAEGHRLSSQLGNVRVGDNVEVGTCSTIDRATYGSTVIGDGTKIDNLVMIGHNCHIGRKNLLCAHTGIAGSTTTGDFVVMAGRVGVRDHVHIGEGAVLGAMAGVMGNIPDRSRFVGIPATPEKEQFKLQIALSRLPETQKQVKAMQRALTALEDRIKANKETGETKENQNR